MNELHKEVLTELQAQNKNYTDAYWEIYDNKEAVPSDQQSRMREELLKNYSRTVALLDGQAGLDKEREIADLEKQRLKIQEESRLQEDEIKAEYRLKHTKLTAQTDFKSEIVKKEFEIKTNAETETLEIKRAQIVPTIKKLPRRWWQILFRLPAKFQTNYAYELASRKADLEAAKYLSAREEEILKLEAEQSGTDELELAVKKVLSEYAGVEVKGRKAKIINKAFSELVKPLCKVFARRERALNDLIARLSDVGNSAIDEPSERQEGLKASAEDERGELQGRAVSLLTEFCQKRIDELQQEQINKPKRQRIRKTRSEIEGK